MDVETLEQKHSDYFAPAFVVTVGGGVATGVFAFRAVVEKISQRFTMFQDDGTRADGVRVSGKAGPADREEHCDPAAPAFPQWRNVGAVAR